MLVWRIMQVRPYDDKEAEEYKMVLYRFAERCSFHLSDIQVEFWSEYASIVCQMRLFAKKNLSGSDYINFFGLVLSLIVWCYLLMSCHAFFGDVLQFQLSDSVHRWGHSSSHVDRPHQPPLNQVRLMLYLLPLVAILLPLVVIALIVIYCKNPHCRWKLPEAELGAVGACKHTLPLFGNL